MAVVGTPIPMTMDPTSKGARVSEYASDGNLRHGIPVGSYMIGFDWVAVGTNLNDAPWFYIHASPARAVVVRTVDLQIGFSGTAPAVPITAILRLFRFRAPFPQQPWGAPVDMEKLVVKKSSAMPNPSAEWNIATESLPSAIIGPGAQREVNEAMTWAYPIPTALGGAMVSGHANPIKPLEMRFEYPEAMGLYYPVQSLDWRSGLGFHGYVEWDEYLY